MKTGLKQRMNTLDWMDDYTRQRAKEKVSTESDVCNWESPFNNN